METSPKKDSKHHALDAFFLGEWSAAGTSYGGTDQSGDPKANSEPWSSTHSAKWHTGSFFLIQDERANIAGRPFDTLSVIGVDPASHDLVARTFDNNGFYRHYALSVDGAVWTLSGETERARIEFADGNRTQLIKWEWKPKGEWLPLCDRTATRID